MEGWEGDVVATGNDNGRDGDECAEEESSRARRG